MKANKIAQAIMGFCILAPLFFGCNKNSNQADSRFEILVSTDLEGEKYSILDTVTDSLIYNSGHNPITLDTIINGTYIFYESIITQECCGNFIVYNPEEDLLMTAFLNWLYMVDEAAAEKLLKGKDIYDIVSLDIVNKTVSVKYLDGSIETLDLKGEQYGDYWVEYDVYPNTMVADTLILSPADTIITMNHTIHGKIFYKGKFISEPVITSKSFKGIQDPEIYILAPTNKVWFKIEGDELVANTGMYMNDSDCGYWVEIRIDSTGQRSLSYISEENMGD